MLNCTDNFDVGFLIGSRRQTEGVRTSRGPFHFVRSQGYMTWLGKRTFAERASFQSGVKAKRTRPCLALTNGTESVTPACKSPGVFWQAEPHQKKPRKFCPHRHRHQNHHHHPTMPRPRLLKRKAANCPPSPSRNASKSPDVPPTGTPAPKIRLAMNKPASTDLAPADKPTTADPTSFEPATAIPQYLCLLSVLVQRRPGQRRRPRRNLPVTCCQSELLVVTKRLLRSPMWSVCKSWKAHLTTGRSCKSRVRL